MKTKRKVLTILLALCVALTMMPTAAMAASTPPDFSDGWTALTVDTNGAITTTIEAGGKYFLSEDLTISNTFVVSVGTADNPVTLDLNGHVLKYENASTDGSVIKVESSGNLILQDSNPTAEHKFDTTNDPWVLAADGATGDNIKSVTGGIITGGTGTNVKPNIYSNDYTYGGGVYVYLGNFTMTGGNIVGCSSTTFKNRSYGGGICAKGNSAEACNINIEGGNIIGCTAGAAGGGVFAEYTTVNMSGGNILNCTAGVDGGGGVQINLGTFTMSGGSIKYCKYTGNNYGGGAVRIYTSINASGTFNMSGGEITDCTSTNYGGGVFVNDFGCVFNMTGGTIKDCKSNDENLSAGVYLRNSSSEMNAGGGSIYDNVYVNNERKITHSSGAGCTAFYGKVTNKGTIEYGTFYDTVTNNGTITGGTFYGGITGEGTISGIQIDFMDGEALCAKQVIKDTNTAITQIDEPKKDGYTFGGWYYKDTNNNTVKIEFDKNMSDLGIGTNDNSIKLYANWQSKSSGSHRSYIQKPSVSLGTDAKAEKAADGSTIYTTAEGSIALSRDGRTAAITPADGYEVANVSVNGKDMGAVTTLTGLKTGDEIIVSFKLTAEAQAKAEVAQIKALAEKMSLTARSTKTAKKNIKVTLKTDEETTAAIKEIQNLGYTVKYKFYRSTKKSSGYKAMLTKSGRSYTNTNGKAGTKYYYKARVQIYDQDGKLITQTALKQCQYASRTWTK